MTPFYRKALALFTRTQEAQIAKGLAKYPNTFNPHEWTPEELLNHALEETVDTVHYLVGLKELLDAKDKRIQELEKHLAIKRGTPEINSILDAINIPPFPKKVLVPDLRNLEKFKMDANGNLSRNYDMNFNPHFDQDDQ